VSLYDFLLAYTFIVLLLAAAITYFFNKDGGRK
jgi:hypothetical protein